MSLHSDLSRFAEKTNQSMSDVVVSSIIQINKLVIFQTPVDEGYARGGWVASIDRISSSQGKKDKDGNRTLKAANEKAKLAPGHIYYLTNNIKYIRILEYGLYPNPPLLGTWNKKDQTFEKRSQGGFSELAPHGMARVSVQNFKHMVKKAVNES